MATLIFGPGLLFGVPAAKIQALPIRHALDSEIVRTRVNYRDDNWAEITVVLANGFVRRFVPLLHPDCIFLDPRFERSLSGPKNPIP